MDAPPEREKIEPFIRIAHLFLKAGLQVPHILEEDLAQGFILLSDLGNRT
jgi:aminoglycoside/choline kinase family phosphotransferase